MEKSDKKRILTKILIVIAALTLLSCCFLGSTFARYVTSGSGTAATGVAKWDINSNTSYELDLTLDANKISPNDDEANKGENKTAWMKVAEIANDGDVSATIEVAATNLQAAWAEGASTGDNSDKYTSYSEGTALGAVFTIAFAKNDSGEAIETLTLAPKATQDIYAQVTWTTQSDDQDTFYGEYLKSLTWSFTFTATQASQLPTT